MPEAKLRESSFAEASNQVLEMAPLGRSLDFADFDPNLNLALSRLRDGTLDEMEGLASDGAGLLESHGVHVIDHVFG
jgi:hypothetical protein